MRLTYFPGVLGHNTVDVSTRAVSGATARSLFADPLVVAYSWPLQVFWRSNGPQPFERKA